MPVRQYANAPATTLSASCTNVATTISVASTTGLPVTFPYTLILDRGTASEEAVSVTAAAGTTLTVTRGIDSTTAFAHNSGATVVHGITAQDIREANAHVNASSGVHGLGGSVVGTTDVQTLTNKTLTSPVIGGTPTGVGAVQLTRKAAIESVVSSTVMQNDDHLLFTAEAGATYDVTIVFDWTAGGGGIKMWLAGPANNFYTMGLTLTVVGLTGVTVPSDFSAASGATVSVQTPAGASASMPVVFVRAVVQYSAAGTVNFQWAQNTSDAVATQMSSAGFLVATRIA